MLIHVVGHLPTCAVPFSLGEVADRFWLKLRVAFPEALAACVLPAQVHLLLPSSFEPRGTSEASGGPAVGALRLLLGSLSWTLGGGTTWTPVTSRTVALERLLGEVRALHERPCKMGLTSQPAEWPWSTERDLLGARIDPWVSAERLARQGGSTTAAMGHAQLRRYVSREPGLAPLGDSLRVVRFSRSKEERLTRLMEAVDAACLYAPRALRNAIAVHFARERGIHDVHGIAAWAGIAVASVERILKVAPPPGLECAARCASDPRLTFRPTGVDLRAG
jgi:hypothetical protein